MTTQMTATDLKATLLGVLDRVSAGEEVEITKHGQVVARLTAARGAHALRGCMTGQARTTVSDDDVFATGQAWEAG